jgi:hypothetical protein
VAVVVLVALLMAVGVAGTIIPLIPGLGLVVVAAAIYGIADGFGTVGAVAMLVIVALGVAGTAAGIVLPGRAALQTGAPRSSLALAAVGAVVGFFVVPVVGLPLGGVLGIYVGERLRTGDGAVARRSTVATLRAFGIAALAQIAAGIAMVLAWIAWVVAG